MSSNNADGFNTESASNTLDLLTDFLGGAKDSQSDEGNQNHSHNPAFEVNDPNIRIESPDFLLQVSVLNTQTPPWIYGVAKNDYLILGILFFCYSFLMKTVVFNFLIV